MRLLVRRVDPRAVLPTRAHDGDAGYDLRALDAVTLAPGERAAVPTGISIALPPGFAGLVIPRSGTALAHGITLVNAPGLVDEGYRGELKVLLLNTDRVASFTVAAGDRIAQLVLIAPGVAEVIEVDSLDTTQRGEGGFGSSGR